MTQVNFWNISSSDSGPVFQISASKLESIRNNFESNIIDVANSIFLNITSSNGAVYYGKRLQNNATFSFENIVFSNIHVTNQGGVFYVEEAAITSSAAASAVSGSAGSRILTQNAANNYFEYFIVTSSNFSNISAYSGGIYYSTYPNQGNTSLVFNQNIFANVSVQERGTIIYTNDSTISAIRNRFINNSALIAGSIIYSQIATLNISVFNSQNQIQGSNSNTQPLAFSPNFLDIEIVSIVPYSIQYPYPNSSFLLTNLTSYSLQSFQFNFGLKYTDSQISQNVVDVSKSVSIEMTFQIPGFESKKYIGNCTARACSLSPDQIILAGKAQNIVQIDASYQSYESPFYSSSQRFFIQLRECIPGEINNTFNQICTYCDINTFSLNPSDKSCSPCPASATCDGGSDIILNPGYWRNSSSSPNIVACNDSGTRCLGGGPTNCSVGFIGPSCAQCDIELGYIANGPLSCSECPSDAQIISIGVISFLGLLAYQFFVVYTTFKYNKKLHAETQDETGTTPVRTGAYMVILATYSQVSSVVSKLSVGYMTDLFGVSGAVGNPNQKIFFSLACLLICYHQH